jgi:cell division septal protein FtsQ
MHKQIRNASSPRPKSSQGRNGAPPRLRKNKKRRNWGPVNRILFLAVVLLAVGIWLCVDKRFHIRDVRYDGYTTVPKSEIVALAHIKPGANLFTYTILQHKKIALRIEKAEPAIEAVHVRPSPPHTLVVHIQERVPYVQVRINLGPLMLLDPSGVPYRVITVRNPRLPAIIVPGDTPVPALGKKVSDKPDNAIGVGLTVVSLLMNGNQFQPLKLREVRVGADLYSMVQMSDRPLIKLGLPNDLSKKLANAATALNGDPVRAQNAEYLDVTLPDKPAIKMKDTTAKPGIMD